MAYPELPNLNIQFQPTTQSVPQPNINMNVGINITQPMNPIMPSMPVQKQMQYTVNLLASNKKFVCAESGGGKEAKANRDKAKGWETFKVIMINGDKLMHGCKIALLSDKSMFLNVLIDSLYFNSSSILDSTTFTVIHPTGPGEVFSNNWVALMTNDGRYVSYESEKVALKCSKELGPCELFKVKILSFYN